MIRLASRPQDVAARPVRDIRVTLAKNEMPEEEF